MKNNVYNTLKNDKVTWFTHLQTNAQVRQKLKQEKILNFGPEYNILRRRGPVLYY